MPLLLMILTRMVPALFSRKVWVYWLGFVIPVGIMISLEALFAPAWVPLPFTQNTLGLMGSMGIGLSTLTGVWLGLTINKAKAAPFEEQTLKLARKAEKAKVERDLATDRAAALEAKIATLEVALQKALSSGRGPTV